MTFTKGEVGVLAQVTAAIADDMNQPLMAISANAGAALRRLRHDPPQLELLEALLHEIIAQSQRAGSTMSAWQAVGQRDPASGPDELAAAVRHVLAGEGK